MFKMALTRFYVWIRGVNSVNSSDDLDGQNVIHVFNQMVRDFPDNNLPAHVASIRDRVLKSNCLYFRKEVYTMRKAQIKVEKKYDDFIEW